MKTRISPSTALTYGLVGVCGAAAFLYPFWLPAEALPAQAHSATAPLVAALIALLALLAVSFEVRNGSMNSSTVAVLGVLAASAGMLRLLDIPGGGSGIFFLVVLGGVAFGARLGLLLGLAAMAVSAVLTGGIGPWLPFQMLGLGLIGAVAGGIGHLTRHLHPVAEVVAVAAYGWLCGFAYGAVLNLWFWPFALGDGPLAWNPDLSLGETFSHYWSFYVTTSLAWDAAGAFTNALLILLTGLPVLRTFRRFGARIRPAVWIDATGDRQQIVDMPETSAYMG